MGKFLFYALLVDFTVEGLDWLHRLYAADESIFVLKQLAGGRLFNTLLVIQLCLGTLLPLLALGSIQVLPGRIPVWFRQRIYFNSAFLILAGVLAMRWNVVIGGQLFSKSLRGFTTFKLGLAGQEGWLLSVALIMLPFAVLGTLVWLFLPENKPEQGPKADAPLAS